MSSAEGKSNNILQGYYAESDGPFKKGKDLWMLDVKSHADTKSMLSLSLTDELKDSQGGSI